MRFQQEEELKWRYDLLYNKGNNSRYVSNSKYAHSVIKIWKKYYNISAIKTGLFIFMERLFKAPRILKKCKFFLKIYYSKSND